MDSLIRADLSQRALLRPGDTPWVGSPSPGVMRRPLDRMGGETARATSLVRYAAGSAFPEHPHPEGEEIFVMDGVFSDESGDHPAGSYLRNPPGSAHSPHSATGCLLFVKLRQFDPSDKETVRIETHKAEFHPGQVPGLTVFPLHSFGGVSSALVQWAPGTRFLPHTHWSKGPSTACRKRHPKGVQRKEPFRPAQGLKR